MQHFLKYEFYIGGSTLLRQLRSRCAFIFALRNIALGGYLDASRNIQNIYGMTYGLKYIYIYIHLRHDVRPEIYIYRYIYIHLRHDVRPEIYIYIHTFTA